MIISFPESSFLSRIHLFRANVSRDEIEKVCPRKCKVTHSDGKQITGCLGTRGGEGRKEGSQKGRRKLLRIMGVFTILIVLIVSQGILMSKFTRFCNLHMCILLYVSYTSIKLLFFFK